MDNPKSSKLILALFGIYILILAWAVLWKIGVPYIGSGTLRIINLIPFWGSERGTFNTISETCSNIVIFVPFGLYISLLAPKWNFIKRITPIFLTSFAFEALQYILAVGRSDVTDLIVNTAGGIVGIAVYALLSRLFGKNANRAITVIFVVGTFLALIAAGYFFTHIRFRAPQ
jgi:glycopeptide antibiotics resistance protein